MRKHYLWLPVVLLLFAACNRPGANDAPAAKPIVDTTADVLMKDFETGPQAKGNNCVDVSTTDEGVPADKSPELMAALQKSIPAPQRFTINTAQAAHITGAQGTQVSLTPGCFVDTKGRIVKDEVQLELRECYSLNDMLRHQLNTSVKGTPMESKGIISILAYYKGQQLKLKEGEQVQIQFPWTDLPNDYHFAYGVTEKEGYNWLPAEDYTRYASLPEFNGTLPAARPTAPSFTYQGLDLTGYLKEFITYPEEAKRNELSSAVDAVLQISADGRVEQVNAAAAYKIFREDLTRQLMAMPQWAPASYGGRNIPCSIHVWLDFDIRRTEQVVVKVEENDVTYFYHTAAPALAEGSTPKNSGNYSRSFSRLGWINCCRFLNADGVKADVIVRSDANSSIKLVMKGYNSIVKGESFVGYTRFRNIPVGTPVFVLGVQQQESGSQFSLDELKLEKQTIVTPVWKKTSETSYAEILARININS